MSTPPHTATPTADDRRARGAVAVLFGVNAALLGTLVPRLPEVRDTFGLSLDAYGAVVAAVAMGSLLAGPAVPAALRRWGSGPLAARGSALLAVLYVVLGVLVALAGARGGDEAVSGAALLALVVGVLGAMGAVDGAVDVAMNSHGFRVQRRYHRSIVTSFHGVWSVSSVAGALVGSLAVSLRVPIGAHLATTGLLLCALALGSGRFLLPGADPVDAQRHEHARAAGRPPLRVLALLAACAAVAVCGGMVEEAGSNWGALLMIEEGGASPGTAGLAFVALSAAMTIGRFTGDRLLDALGARRVVRAGGLLIAAGITLAVALPTPVTIVAGYALAGFGTATLVPTAMQAGDRVPALPPGVGLTAVSWTLRFAFLASPLLIGAIGQAAGLRLALLLVVGAGAATVLLAPALAPRAPGGSDPRAER